jgi:hypothetical protein
MGLSECGVFPGRYGPTLRISYTNFALESTNDTSEAGEHIATPKNHRLESQVIVREKSNDRITEICSVM